MTNKTEKTHFALHYDSIPLLLNIPLALAHP